MKQDWRERFDEHFRLDETPPNWDRKIIPLSTAVKAFITTVEQEILDRAVEALDRASFTTEIEIGSKRLVKYIDKSQATEAIQAIKNKDE